MVLGQTSLGRLRAAVSGAEDCLRRATSATSLDLRAESLVHLLRGSVEFSKGIILLRRLGLVNPCWTLSRGLLDRLFLAGWVVQAEDRAHGYQNLAKHESKRGMRKFISTDLLVTQSPGLLASMNGKIPDRPHISQFAKESGLEKLYTVLYSVGSEAAHGFDFGITRQGAEEITTILEFSAAFLATTTHMADRWVFDGQVTKPEELEYLLSPRTIRA